jgi:hypothetical protein
MTARILLAADASADALAFSGLRADDLLPRANSSAVLLKSPVVPLRALRGVHWDVAHRRVLTAQRWDRHARPGVAAFVPLRRQGLLRPVMELSRDLVHARLDNEG